MVAYKWPAGRAFNRNSAQLSPLSLDVLSMLTRARLRLEAPAAQEEPTAIATPPGDHPDSPVDADDADDADDEIEHLPQEKRIQLAVAASQAKLMSERKAADYYGVPRSTVQARAKGILTRKEAHAHERSLTSPQEEILAEWIKVRATC
jgi:hypothetical protein